MNKALSYEIPIREYHARQLEQPIRFNKALELSQNDSEQRYFTDGDFFKDATVYRLVKPVETQAQSPIDLLQNIAAIDSVWGALENKQAKNIRHYLRNERALTGKQNHMKGYWREDK